jgi:hypothetical protein
MTFPRWLHPGAVVFVAIWLVLMSFGRGGMLRDPGTFWHTRTGELILGEGFIRTDPYTFTFGGTWWVPYQWLGEVSMALAHRVAGFDAELLGAVTLLSAVFAWLSVRLLRTGLHPVLVAAVVALGLAAAGSHFHVRPHLFTLAALAATTALLVDCEQGRSPSRSLLWLVPLFIVWTNVHGGLLGGLATVLITSGGWWLFWMLGRPSPVCSWRATGGLALLALACALTMLASPYGTDMVKIWSVVMGEPVLKLIIIEHRPLDATLPYSWPIFGLAAVYLFVLFGVKGREVRVTWLLPLVWFAQTIDRCRHASLFVVTTLVVLAAMWPATRWARSLAQARPDFYQPDAAVVRRPWWAAVWLPILCVLLSLSLQIAGVQLPIIGAGWARHSAKQWPVELLDAIHASEPAPGEPNRMFTDYLNGGFAIYHAPGYKVFVDDRCEVFGGPWLMDYLTSSRTDQAAAIDRWERTYGTFNYALLSTECGFDDYFRTAPGWECVKRTESSAFYRRLPARP